MGHWKNYDELEDSLSVEEVLFTLKAIREKDERDKKFGAAIQGIDLDDTQAPDITTLSGGQAAKAGFGIGMGLGHEVQGL